MSFAGFAAAETMVVPPPPPVTSIVISVAEQKLTILRDGMFWKKYPISTSKFGLGDSYGSYKTPVGHLRVCEKIGEELSPGSVIKERHATGEVLPANAPGRDPIVTRVIWLDGLEPQNKNALSRGIYIHGTPEERTIGTPVSWGCIRMRSKDVIQFFDAIPVGTVVSIIPDKLPHMHRYRAPKLAPPAPAPAPAVNDKPPEQEKSVPSVGPSLIASKPSSRPENPAPATVKPSDIAAASPLPAIAEAPQSGNSASWHALKGSYLLANIPFFNKLDDHNRKTVQATQ